MTRGLRGLATVAALGTALCAWDTACAQKRGGILRMYSIDRPATMSILEEATAYSQRPMMGVFNNLVVYDQAVKQNTLETIVPDLATGWSWNEDATELTLPLHRGVKWHDGKPFTAQDVKCTWDLLTGKGDDKLRVNPTTSVSAAGYDDELTASRRDRCPIPIAIPGYRG
jgi:peptide/nickel transport system substrate-binding protein